MIAGRSGGGGAKPVGIPSNANGTWELPRLGVNIDHIATLRQLRGTPYPDLLAASRLAEKGGARQITVHLREDRRHIQDTDVKLLRANLSIGLNLEMAVSAEILKFATRVGPDWCCLVPEKRREVTTEGGLDVERGAKAVAKAVQTLKKSGIKVSLFIEPSVSAVKRSRELGADAVELHTGRFCLATQAPEGSRLRSRVKRELGRVQKAAEAAERLGLGVHAGHGLDNENVRMLTEFRAPGGAPLIAEYNIGHWVVCRAALVGLESATREILSAITAP